MERRTRCVPWIVLLAAASPVCAGPASTEAALPALAELASLPLGTPEAAASPGAARMALDPVGLGSHAARLTYRATSAWTLSASAFGLGEKVGAWGGTAISAVFVQPMGTEAFTAAASWGRTSVAGEVADSFLLEGSFQYARHQFFARAASVSPNEESGGDHTYPVKAGTLGYTYARPHGRQEIGIGFSITAFKVPPALEPAYGELPLAWQLHLSVQAAVDRKRH